MTTAHRVSPPASSMPPGVLALAVGAFAIGVTEFIVVGILPAIAKDLRISIESAGSLVSLYALALAIGTPLLVLLMSRLPRKAALLGLMSVFLVGNLLAAFPARLNGCWWDGSSRPWRTAPSLPSAPPWPPAWWTRRRRAGRFP